VLGRSSLIAVPVSDARPSYPRVPSRLRERVSRAGPKKLRIQGCDGHNHPVLTIGVVALGVDDVARATRFWCEALGYELRSDGFGGWSTVLTPPDGKGTKIALQHSQTAPQDYPRLHFDLHVADAKEQVAEVERLVSLGSERIDWDRYPDDPDFVVLEDPDGNRFCVVDISQEHE
jgi:catechol 2,3-dioxygenase-like lactoylglutathione lyase family enzyme